MKPKHLIKAVLYGTIWWYNLYDSCLVLKSKELLHGTICMIRFDDYVQTCLFKITDLYFNWKYNESGTCSCSNCHCNILKRKNIEWKKKMKNCLGEAILRWKPHLLPLYLHPFLILKFSPYCVLQRVSLVYWRYFIKKPISQLSINSFAWKAKRFVTASLLLLFATFFSE